MPITPENFENFFIGMSAETHVASQLAMAGFECSKISPDSGVDYLITNIARRRARDEPSVAVELQVKSTLLRTSDGLASDAIVGEAEFLLTRDERDYLMADPARVTAFVVFHSMRQVVDPDSFNYLDPGIDRAIDQDVADYNDLKLAEYGRHVPGGRKRSVLRINRFDSECFWLNGSQLERTVRAKLWRNGPRDDLVGLAVRLDGRNLSLGSLVLVPEARNLIYMLGCKAERQLAEGRFSYDHL